MISLKQVHDFKQTYCLENLQIIEIIKKELSFFQSTILDVGCGLGDIAYLGLSRKKVILIDVLKNKELDFPLRARHERKKIGFYEFSSKAISTIFISHTTQFIDSNPEKFKNKVLELNPKFLVLVLNQNEGVLGKIVEWIEQNFPNSHPEKNRGIVPDSFQLSKQSFFNAGIVCSNFQELANQVAYMMMIPIDSKVSKIELHLKKVLAKPTLNFNQTIDIYERKR